MRVDDFDYDLPEERIAQAPLDERDASRLMLLHRRAGAPRHHRFLDLPSLLAPGDLLVVNDARVIPARLRGRKTATGGRVELLLVEPTGGNAWRALGRSSKGLPVGTQLQIAGGEAEVIEDEGGGSYLVRFDRAPEALLDALESGEGEMPLPPYIHRGEGPAPVDDRVRYQTIFASTPGAVAAPTAGLHFTPRVLDALRAHGVSVAQVTLYVGPGTFLPVRVENVEEHRMHTERYEVSEETAGAIARTRERGGRVVCVGTTSLRTLEAAAAADGTVHAGPGRTDLFVRPGYELRVAQGLLTNFHLPRSTLLMLVSALTGRERLLDAYREAVAERYRFYSYGDAMLVL